MPPSERSHLPRLDPGYYRGFSFVHWTYCIKDRATGWLDERFHFQFRESLLHGLHRYALSCPVYALMPDHMHLMAVGLDESSDQMRFSRFFRKRLNQLLGEHSLQRQPHDHVLNEKERSQESFGIVCQYILENPVRSNLAKTASTYPFCGCMVPGYCDLDPRNSGFWDLFWRIYNQSVTA